MSTELRNKVVERAKGICQWPGCKAKDGQYFYVSKGKGLPLKDQAAAAEKRAQGYWTALCELDISHIGTAHRKPVDWRKCEEDQHFVALCMHHVVELAKPKTVSPFQEPPKGA